MSKIKLAIDGLLSRLDREQSLLIQREEGYVERVEVVFNSPATEKEIKKLPFNLPADYKEFLLMHNGGRLFHHKKYGEGIELFTVKEILKHRAYYGEDFPENWFPIASANDGCYLLITNEMVDNGYLFWFDGISFKGDMYIGMNFEDWFEKIIIAQGSIFWDWDVRKPPSMKLLN